MASLIDLKKTILEVTNTTQPILVKKKNREKFNLDPKIVSEVFGENEISITRDELKNNFNNTKKKVLKVFMWGYPKGGFPAAHLKNMVSSECISKVAELMDEYKDKNLTKEEFLSLQEKLESIEHLGISSYTKLLYFFGIKVEDDLCLIYDKNVIAYLNSKKINEFNTRKWSRTEGYLDYINLVNKLGKQYEIPTDKIEMYLFEEGKKI